MTNVLILAGGGGGALLLLVIVLLVGRRSRSPVAVVPPPHVEIAPVVQMAPPARVARGSVEFPTTPRPSRPTGIRPSHAGRVARTP